MNSKVIDFTGYLLLSLFLAYEIKEESRDLFSSTDKNHPNSKIFGDGCGKFVHWNKFTKEDTFENIIKKCENLNNNQLELPVWRRSLIISFIITVIISIVIYKKLMPFPLFLLYFMIIFFIFYYSFNYYSYHYIKPLSKVQNDNLEKLLKKYSFLKKKILSRNESKNSKNNSPNLV